MEKELLLFASTVQLWMKIEILLVILLIAARPGTPSLYARVAATMPSERNNRSREDVDAPIAFKTFLLRPEELSRWKVGLMVEGTITQYLNNAAQLSPYLTLSDLELLYSFYHLDLDSFESPRKERVPHKAEEFIVAPIENPAQLRHLVRREHLFEENVFWERLARNETAASSYYESSGIIPGKYLIIDGSGSMDQLFLEVNKIHAKAIALQIIRKWIEKRQYPFYVRFWAGVPSVPFVARNEKEALESAMRVFQWNIPAKWDTGTRFLPAVAAAVKDLRESKDEERGIIAITDGELEETISEDGLRIALGGIPLHFVITGSSPKPFLKGVADAYIQVPPVTLIRKETKPDEALERVVAAVERVIR